mmetsp:Transcript_11553/g.22198  ORF Transcript_11553/g.22198 Transcript_11553/m.22198 type:complete len:699 (-) Transcript_11553:330-2426(-)
MFIFSSEGKVRSSVPQQSLTAASAPLLSLLLGGLLHSEGLLLLLVFLVKIVGRSAKFFGDLGSNRNDLFRAQDHGVTVLGESAAEGSVLLGDLADRGFVEVLVFPPEGKALVSDLPILLLRGNNLDNLLGGLSLLSLLLGLLLGVFLGFEELLHPLTATHDSLLRELFNLLLFIFSLLLTGSTLDTGDLDLSTILKLVDERVSGTLTGLDVLKELELSRSDGEVDVTTGVEHVTRVGHQKHSTGVLIARGDQRVNSLEVEEVGRLVHNEKVRAVEGQFGEDDTSLLSAGETLHTSVVHLVLHTRLLQVVTKLTLLLDLRELLAHVLERSHAEIELLRRVLSEVGQLEALGSSDRTLGRSEAASQQLQESRLTGTVRSHDTHASCRSNGTVSLLAEDEDIGSRVLELDVLHRDQRNFVSRSLGFNSREGSWIREREHVALGELASRVTLAPVAVHRNAATDRRGRIGVAVTRNELFTLRVHLLVLQSLLLLEGREVHFVRDKLKILDEQNSVTHVLEEVTVVGHEHERAGVRAETVLEPKHGREVEVVRRVVQQQEIRRLEERTDERNTHTKSSRKIVDVLLLGLLVETKGLQHARNAFLGGVRLQHSKLSFDLGKVGLESLVARVLSESSIEILLALAEHVKQLVAVEDGLDDGSVVRGSLDLLHVEGADVLRESLLEERSVRHSTEESRLTASVGTE